MPRYFFDLDDEHDPTGIELPNDAAAMIEATRFLGEILKHEPQRLHRRAVRVRVRGPRGAVHWCIGATAEASPPS